MSQKENEGKKKKVNLKKFKLMKKYGKSMISSSQHVDCNGMP